MITTKGSQSPELALLAEGRHHDPHHFLGLHETGVGQVIRLWRPGADTVFLEVLGKIVQATKVSELGLFEYIPAQPIEKDQYRIYHPSGLLASDPYAQLPRVGELDTFLFLSLIHI